MFIIRAFDQFFTGREQVSRISYMFDPIPGLCATASRPSAEPPVAGVFALARRFR